MPDVLMKCGLCHLVVIDDDAIFKRLSTAICDYSTINYKVVSKRNHKGISVEIFRYFLNTFVTIAFKNRATVSILAEVGNTVAYAWNSAPIDSTDIICSIPEIGQELRFLLEVNLTPLPTLSQKSSRFGSRIFTSHQIISNMCRVCSAEFS